jgi:hypothetical protein
MEFRHGRRRKKKEKPRQPKRLTAQVERVIKGLPGRKPRTVAICEQNGVVHKNSMGLGVYCEGEFHEKLAPRH